MQPTSHQDLTATLSVLDRHDAEECKSSEASWLPVQQVRAETPPLQGMDFSDYLAFVRVEKAKNLLLNPRYYFTEIAAELGFESLDQFNQAFKKIVEEPPQAYRARLAGIRTTENLDEFLMLRRRNSS